MFREFEDGEVNTNEDEDDEDERIGWFGDVVYVVRRSAPIAVTFLMVLGGRRVVVVGERRGEVPMLRRPRPPVGMCDDWEGWSSTC